MVAISSLFGAAALVSISYCQTIAEINGNTFLSPYRSQAVTGVKGLITAIAITGSKGLFIRSTTPDNDPATSESVLVFGSTLVNGTYAVGDIITLDGTVTEYRSSKDYLYLTEITSATNIVIVSSNNTVTPVVLGNKKTTGLIGTRSVAPPTADYTSLDNNGTFGLPANTSLVSVVNPKLDPSRYGLDFWESLSGEYVQINTPIVLDQPSTYGDTWVYGNWKVTNKNGRGGLTVTAKDGNPEAILIQDPLDGTENPLDSQLGDQLATITGVITYAFGFYTIRPDTAVTVTKMRTPAVAPPTKLTQKPGNKACKGVTMADFNIENFAPGAETGPAVADQIVNYLRNPTIIFLQEVQDNTGSTNDGVVNANQTLDYLVDNIVTAGGPTYSYTEIDPIDGTTGGEPGGNIRNAYLYNPEYVQLVDGTPGSATDANEVLPGPTLKFNPGLIDPNNTAWTNSRRPLVAQWQLVNGGHQFFTVNIHATSKGGSTSLEGDERPPINKGIEKRDLQGMVTGNFTQQILAEDSTANIIATGDWNEYAFVQSQLDFVAASGLRDIDDIVNTKISERYDYLFQQNSQSLVHFYLSPQAHKTKPKLDRVHVNTWAPIQNRTSDHDPFVVQVNVCRPT